MYVVFHGCGMEKNDLHPSAARTVAGISSKAFFTMARTKKRRRNETITHWLRCHCHKP
jgi:hypothetical protein